MSYYTPNATHIPQLRSSPLVDKWITDSRPLPELQSFSEELVLTVASWCLDPQALLNLSSTCTKFARVSRTVSCWLDHHWGRGYDIGILAKKVKRAAAAPEKKFGSDGWGLLVKSAFEKAEFPDDEYMTQWNMNKPLPHTYIEGTCGLGIPGAIEKYQPRGEKWMRVMYDVLTEHECNNLELYPWLNDEALKIRVKAEHPRYLQALVSASELLIRMWARPIAAMTTCDSRVNNQQSLSDIPPHNHRRTSLSSLTYTFLVANKIMQIDPQAQEQRKLFPHPPLGPAIWQNADGDIDPRGLGWIPKVIDTWKDRVYVVGQYAKITSEPCVFAIPRLGRAPMRMCLDFGPDGQITGRGGDFGGRFNIISGSYHKTFVELVKQYEDDDMDTYLATGHMTPWGVYGRWTIPDKPNETLGYWCMWHFEGAPVFHLGFPIPQPDGREVLPTQLPYKSNPNWFEEYEQARDTGKPFERAHGWWEPPPRQPEEVPLPEPDAWGL